MQVRQLADQTARAEPHSEAAVCGLIRERIRSAGLWRLPGVESTDSRTHLVSPEPYTLTREQADDLLKLGPALLAFYSAANDLYFHRDFDWVREYLDIGKPEELLRHARMKYHKRALSRVIRPDILVTDDGFVITELDSVPGGMGQLDCLSAAYEEAGFELLGSPRGMRDGFAGMMRDVGERKDPVCAIVVSEESADYLPEMLYLGAELRETGLRAYVVRPRDVRFSEEGLYIDTGSGEARVDVVYRFFELFDLLNIPKSELLSYAARKRLVAVTPPYKPFLEEKMLLALAHHEALAGYWRSTLGDEDYEFLRRTIAPTFVLDNRRVPPHARISGFEWRGRPIRDWREIADGTQKERALVIKPSGFSPLAWGSRGVKVGHDMSQEEWAAAIEGSLGGFDTSPYVIQPFSETRLMRVRYHGEDSASVGEMRARVRLCPYYYVAENNASLAGVLATACPKDKKLVHGMVDAVMAPCRVQAKES